MKNNNFKILSLFLGLMVSVFAFVACGDDDSDDDFTSGQYAGNRIVGEWVWGQRDMPQEERQHHTQGYIFKANGEVSYYSTWSEENYASEEGKQGTYTVDGIKLRFHWTKSVMKENGETHAEDIDEMEDVEIMYPEEGNDDMFLKRYYVVEGRQGWTEEGPFYKK